MTKPVLQYRQSIDLARFVAAFGVVWAHAVAPGLWVGHLSLALFLILTSFLAIQSMERAGGRFSWLGRAKRIAMPWIFWSLFYALLQVVMSHGGLQRPFDWHSLLIGSTIHLWFLPFVMLASILVPLIGHRIGRPRDLAMACAALVVIAVPLLWFHRQEPPMHDPFPQWAFAFTPFVYGILAAFGHQFKMAWLPLGSMALISAVTFALVRDPWALQPFVAALLFELAWRSPMQSAILPKLGQTAFGIYLVHPFFMLVCYKFLGADVNRILAAIAAFGMSWAATVVMLKIPLLKRMV